MATRLYFSNSQAAPATPAGAIGGWEDTSQFVTRKLLSAKEAGESLALGTQIGDWIPGDRALDRQYVSELITPGVVFTSGVTTVKCQIATREFGNNQNTTSRFLVAILQGSGAGFILLGSPSQLGPATEYINNATLRNKTFADGDTLGNSWTASAGDRLLVEIGHTDASGTLPTGQCRFGAPTGTADHGENETETTSLVPWIELSNDLFPPPPEPVFKRPHNVYNDPRLRM